MFWYPADVPLVLASRSPRRRDILNMAKIPFIAAPVDISEDGFVGSPDDTVSHWARMKALSALESWENNPVLGADTLVSIDGKLLGKPDTPGCAHDMLSRLSGNWHTVLGGVCVLWPYRNLEMEFVETTRVLFRELSSLEIQAYVNTGEPMDKAGAYGIQGLGALFVERLEGCFYNVMGLPLSRLIWNLRERLLEGS